MGRLAGGPHGSPYMRAQQGRRTAARQWGTYCAEHTPPRILVIMEAAAAAVLMMRLIFKHLE